MTFTGCPCYRVY